MSQQRPSRRRLGAAVAEVGEQREAPAAGAVDEVFDRVVGAPAALVGDRQLRVARPLFVEAHQPAEVGFHRQHHRPRGQPVAPGAAGLLVVGLDAGRDRHVPDRAHVGLVDAHAEGVGGDDHVDRVLAARHEAPLHHRALVAFHPGVVGERPQAGAAQLLGDLVGVLAGAAVDDRRAVGRVGEPRLEQRLAARLRALALQRDHVEGDVGTVEARPHPQRLAHLEALRDLDRDRHRRRRRAGHHRRPAEPLGDLRQPQVVGAEVVAPLGDAVGLVDRQQVDLALPDRVEEGPRGEALRRAVDDLRPPVADRLQRRPRCPLRPSPRRPSPPGGRPGSAAATGPASARSAG